MKSFIISRITSCKFMNVTIQPKNHFSDTAFLLLDELYR